MNKNKIITDYLVIGAGIAGLSSAQHLRENGIDVLVVDKSRGVGGRMATRRNNQFRYDHGAQSMAWHTNLLPKLFEAAKRKKILVPSSYSLYDVSSAKTWICKNGMSAWNKHLAQNLTVHLQNRIVRLEALKNGWYAINDEGIKIYCNKIIMTPPMPQTLEIIKNSNLNLPTTIHDSLSVIKYNPVLAMLVTYNTSEIILKEVFRKIDSNKIELLVDNFAKGVSDQPGALTVFSSSIISNKYFEANENTILSKLINDLKDYLPIEPVDATLHRWRYAHTLNSHKEPFVYINDPAPLGLAGDGFSNNGIIGAANSSIKLATHMIST